MAETETRVERERRGWRKVFKKEINDLKAVLEGNDPDEVRVQALLRGIDQMQEELLRLDSLHWEQMMEDEDVDDEDVDKELEEVAGFKRSYHEVVAKVDKLNRKSREEEESNASNVSNASKRKKGCSYRLPKLEFKKFGGDPKDWLYFWSQFQSIHEDGEMRPEEKFQYLMQATEPGSDARNVVDSFPPTAANYPKAIEYLEERFGNKEVLVEVYIRSLLGIVLNEQRNGMSSLATLYDQLATQLRSLESLEITTDKYGAMLFPLVESSLPEETLRAWERARILAAENLRKDKLKHLMVFLKQEVDGEERIRMAQQFQSSQPVGHREKTVKLTLKKPVPTTTNLYNGAEARNKKVCIYCDKPHVGPPSECSKAKQMTLEQKRKIIYTKKACYRCLLVGHRSKDCYSKRTCRNCKKEHDVSICPGVTESQYNSDGDRKATDRTLSNHSKEAGVLLQTLMVKIIHNGNERKVRVIIDTGSMRSYVTKKAVEVLQLPSSGSVSLKHGLFGGTDTKEIHHNLYDVKISSLEDDFIGTFSMMDQVQICGPVSRIPTGPWLKEFEGRKITFSDVGCDSPDIHILFGADSAGKIFTERIYSSTVGPFAMQTRLGWTVMGEVPMLGHRENQSLISLTNLNRDMESLWSLESLGIRDPIQITSELEKSRAAMDKFERNIDINHEGRYEVGLPWITGHPPVADNLEVSKKRLFTATKRLEKEAKVDAYENVFKEWEQLGIIEEVKVDLGELENVSYLPHRPVFNPNSTTTPIRPVFDASCRSEGRPSVNDCLEKGENLIELVPAILSRFRLRKIGITSDIKKAFLQISLKKEDRKYLRFLWWEAIGESSSSRKLKIFQHCRVVFGVNSSPFLLAATLKYHLDKQREGRQLLAQKLKKSLYVDNCCGSEDDDRQANHFQMESTLMLNEGKFELRGWLRTDPTSEVKPVSVLGLMWDVREDTLQINVENLAEFTQGKVTKRRILSLAHRIYDPVGFTSPVTLKPKLLLQELWDSKVGWDEEVSSEMKNKFTVWLDGLQYLRKIRIPRWISFRKLEECKLQLHLFTDASKDASSACVFLRCDDGVKVAVQLVMAKSRVAPKNGTIPRLELLGCLIGARLLNNVKSYLELSEVTCFMWTDSANALYWIQNEDNWAPYVYNRVKEIVQLTRKEDWRHVSGSLNPADLPSRGCSAKQLMESRWWEGPSWLNQKQEEWPNSVINVELEVVMAEKYKPTTSALSVVREQWYLERFSTYPKILHLFGWLLRWRNKVKKIAFVGTWNLTCEELHNAEKSICKLVQREAYQDGAQVLKQLSTMVGGDGLRRVKTKLGNRLDTEDFRFPILLPHDHKLAKLLIAAEHSKMSHMGVASLICHLRERFWITKARVTVKKAISPCIICKRFSSKRIAVEEGTLPEDRVRDAEVFEVTGIDLGGPLHLKDGSKVWFVLFSCAVYRAVHLELATSLSTEELIMCMRRFIARRGRPAVIYSDNGRNLVGLSNSLKKVDWNAVEQAEETQGIIWRHIPPASPWYGGFWERMIGVVKDLLKKNVGKTVLSFQELQTVLCDVEYVVNHRPLTYFTEDETDPVTLTPSLFMEGVKSFGNPDLDQIDLVGASERRMMMMKELRGRFRSEYLGKLKNAQNPVQSDEVKVGDLVFVEKETLKKSFWPIGMIAELHRDQRGTVRRATVKTSDGSKVYTLQRLFLMEVNVAKEEVSSKDSDGSD